MVADQEQDKREEDHTDDLGHHPDVVDHGKDAYAGDVEHRRYDQCRKGDGDLVVDREVPAEDDGKGVGESKGNRCDREKRRRQVEPADHPAGSRGSEASGPLIDGTGDGVVGGELGKAEGYQELAGGDDGPAPEEGRAAGADAQRE